MSLRTKVVMMAVVLFMLSFVAVAAVLPTTPAPQAQGTTIDTEAALYNYARVIPGPPECPDPGNPGCGGG